MKGPQSPSAFRGTKKKENIAISYALARMSLLRPNTRAAALSTQIDEIRGYQEQRLSGALKAWEAAKVQLEEAIAKVEAQEKEYESVSEEVRRNLDALERVLSLSRALESRASAQQEPSEAPPESAMEKTSIDSGSSTTPLIGRTSRALFGLRRRSA